MSSYGIKSRPSIFDSCVIDGFYAKLMGRFIDEKTTLFQTYGIETIWNAIKYAGAPSFNTSEYLRRFKSQLPIADDDKKILSQVFKLLCKAASDITEQWVAHTNLKPELGEGDWVICRNRAGVIKLEPEALKRGCYVFHSSLASKGREVPFEDVRLLQKNNVFRLSESIREINANIH